LVFVVPDKTLNLIFYIGSHRFVMFRPGSSLFAYPVLTRPDRDARQANPGLYRPD
jgi:hypothetical protein